MAQYLPILHEQYQTEPYGPWYTREAYPWEYDARFQECIQIMNNPTSWNDPAESNRWFQQHIQMWQTRASHIRQEWAKQEAVKQVTQQVTQPASQPAKQPIKQPAKQLVTQQKKKRNEKTRQQYKRRTLHQANMETIAEKLSDNQAISTKNPGTLSSIPRQVLSTIPRQIMTQDSHPTEHITIFWPDISGTWHITELSTQEKDLLRRSQPNHHSHLLAKDRTIHIWKI